MSKAQNNLGYQYATGTGVKQDYFEAAKWLLKAADQGHTSAQFGIGQFYLQGAGVTQNKALGIKYLRLAAQAGLKEAQTLLRQLNETW